MACSSATHWLHCYMLSAHQCCAVFVLLAGQMCGNTLRQTLGYFGAQLGASELAEGSLRHLQVCADTSCPLCQVQSPTCNPQHSSTVTCRSLATHPPRHVLPLIALITRLCCSSSTFLFLPPLSTCAPTQSCITAAVQLVQARNPSYSTARCWHTLFSKYCELWQQQHPLMGLWSSAGGWVGGVRAGGLLTVLRSVTPAEALGQESTPAVLKHVMRVGAA